ncbi:hypothetical protein M404DRAFT_36802 [Pisolithus tinctorius Marx 270]|uniref:Uncharacterized protein n=1 Tax=Pisolithus tinctorius Marx 270 TaxID=870435 RepID=A0A0C3MUR5_PISTI|nr:hypothetical protein M404DRAFT_36802 [Pisolithus tinctorius Marx 270]
MTNLISFQLPITHPGTYRVSFMPPTSGVVTLEITTVLAVEHKSTQVQTDPIVDVEQDSVSLKISEFLKSPARNKQPVCTSECGEKSISSSFCNTPFKAMSKDAADIDDSTSLTEPESEDEETRTALANGNGLFTVNNFSLSSQHPSLSQDSVSTFILMRHMQAGLGDPPRGIGFTQLEALRSVEDNNEPLSCVLREEDTFCDPPGPPEADAINWPKLMSTLALQDRSGGPWSGEPWNMFRRELGGRGTCGW